MIQHRLIQFNQVFLSELTFCLVFLSPLKTLNLGHFIGRFSCGPLSPCQYGIPEIVSPFFCIRTSYPPWVRGGSSKFTTDGARFSEFIIGIFLQMWRKPILCSWLRSFLLEMHCLASDATDRPTAGFLWIDISTVDYCRSSTCHDITMLRLLYFLYFYTFSGVSRVSNTFADSYNIWDSTHGVFLPEILQVRFMFMFNFQSLFFFPSCSTFASTHISTSPVNSSLTLWSTNIALKNPSF